MLEVPSPTVSILIKALNEERHIAAAIESALAALSGMSGEVILADSASNDRTVEIAAEYPIKIVRLSNVEERCCGVGVQLGYQYCSGRYICLIDGDMRLYDGFLRAAIRILEDHPDVGGVGGIIVERELESLEYARRAKTEDMNRRPGEVAYLGCGGVYRREAIASVGYFGDRNLHSWEELDLGIRLHAMGWKLLRIDLPAIDHNGHSGSAFRLLLQRWSTRYLFGTGEIMRACIGHGHFRSLLRHVRKEAVGLSIVHAWWLCLLAVPFITGGGPLAAVTAATVGLSPFVLMSARWRSVRLGTYSIVSWNLYALAMWPGLLRPRVDPTRWIESTVVRDGLPTDYAAAAELVSMTQR
ncbi:MAG: glycosyltransferase [Xanthobacteraceae bacterium]|jgi:glycosyltransferase involved in cell wall biosynthesis